MEFAGADDGFLVLVMDVVVALVVVVVMVVIVVVVVVVDGIQWHSSWMLFARK